MKPVFYQYLFIENWYFDIERNSNTYLQGKGRWIVVRQVVPPKMKRKLNWLIAQGLIIVLQKKWWKIKWRIIVSQDFDACASTMILSPRRRRLSVEALARLKSEWTRTGGDTHWKGRDAHFRPVRVFAVDLRFEVLGLNKSRLKMTYMIYNTRCFFSRHLVRWFVYCDIFADKEGTQNLKNMLMASQN